MNAFQAGVACVLFAGAALAQPGLKPPPSASDYRAHAANNRFEIGARLLTVDEAHSTFATDVGRGYLVVEVALFPSGDLDVRTADFSLRVGGSQDLLRPIASRIVAARIFRPPQRGRNVDVFPTVGVGYDRYGGGGGWTTAAGVGVGVGGRGAPRGTDQDLRTMEAELGDQALPEGVRSQPVAGYLYFAVPKRRNVTFDLEYRSGPEQATLPLVSR